MKMKRKVFMGSIAVVLVLLICGTYILFKGNPFKEAARKSQVENYITHLETNGELESMVTHYDMKRGDYLIDVTFDNEENIVYKYVYNTVKEEVVLIRITQLDEHGQENRIMEGENDKIKT